MITGHELKTTADIVKDMLMRYPETRNSDNVLYLKVLELIGWKNGIDINSMSIPRFLMHMKDYGFPCFESVRRTRQKIQASCPELAGNDTVEAQRVLNEEVYRDYAKGLL